MKSIISPSSHYDTRRTSVEEMDLEEATPLFASTPSNPSRQKSRWLALSALLLCALVVTGAGVLLVMRFVNSPTARTQLPVTGYHGAVATEHAACSEIGLSMLRQRGSAVDAAIAAGLCIGTVNSFSSGIGGGGFMLVRLRNGTSSVVDFRETAPAASNSSMYINQTDKSQYGALAVAIPGELKGYEYAHRKWGKLPWHMLVQPSIDLARKGFPVTPVMFDRFQEESETLLTDPAFQQVFAPQGRLLQVGELVRRERFAETLEIVARNGSWSFYEGALAQTLVEFLQKRGGIATQLDFQKYQVVEREPLVGYYHGRQVITTPPPTSGPVLLLILNLLERFNLAAEGRTGLSVHRLIESFKHGYALRTRLGDFDFIPENERPDLEKLLSKLHANLLRANISDARTFPVPFYQPEFEPVESPGTTHICTLDAEGQAVSLTSTINLIFGSRLMEPSTGIILNDQMDDFSTPNHTNAFGLPPSPHNFIHPGQRPLSSAAPTMVVGDGNKLEMLVGASGGSKITTAILQTLIQVLDWKRSAQKAVDEPRVHHQLIPNQVLMEKEYEDQFEMQLEANGHDVKRLSVGKGLADVQAITVRSYDGQMEAASDPRKGGQARAY